jgi:hypothetical protein
LCRLSDCIASVISLGVQALVKQKSACIRQQESFKESLFYSVLKGSAKYGVNILPQDHKEKV